MATSEALRVDVAEKDSLSRIYPSGGLLSSNSTDWGGLYCNRPLKWWSIPVRNIA